MITYLPTPPHDFVEIFMIAYITTLVAILLVLPWGRGP
jgi:hypothetical protein